VCLMLIGHPPRVDDSDEYHLQHQSFEACLVSEKKAIFKILSYSPFKVQTGGSLTLLLRASDSELENAKS
jgi:hypothetical protein